MADQSYPNQRMHGDGMPPGSDGLMNPYDGLQAAHENGLHPVDMNRSPRPEISTEKLGLAAGTPYTFATHSQTQFTTPQTAHHFPHSNPSGGVLAPSATGIPTHPPPQDDSKILGLRKPTFFLTLSNVVLIIALILVGVLPSQLNKGQNTNGTCAANSSSPSSTSAPAPTYSSGGNPRVCFDTTTTPRAGVQFGTPQVDCPRPNNETVRYTVPATNLTFTRVCGVDYTGNDMGSFPVASMPDCLALCAQLNLYPSSTTGRCLGVSWVFGNGLQGQGVSYCYPKYNVSTKTMERLDTESAFLVTS